MKNKFESGAPHKEGYSEEFVAKVKAEFPDWADLHKHLDAGSDFVGRYLDDSRGFSMQPEDIVKALEGGEQDKVLEAAKKADRIGKLYAEWSESRQK
ncbi:hypothetical protein KJ854_05475 [Patescibacteria group bacterium]|nr:hypothetical protein [Patescibacteria group bacterium]MBU4141492.1 hypothetical protein [Patescibacteria group bacterium]